MCLYFSALPPRPTVRLTTGKSTVISCNKNTMKSKTGLTIIKTMNTKTIWILSLFLCLLGGNGYAQKEIAIWYFGPGYGLDFNYSPPELMNDGAIYSYTGASSICDAEGNLLFYTNGETVWNRAHKPMPNGTGLKGSWKSLQSSLIIPHPGNPHQYYLFTMPWKYDPLRASYYSLVDMRMDGGLGDVVEKNVFRFLGTNEMQTGVMHANGKDYWALTLIESDLLVATLITSDGVQHSKITKIPSVNYTGYGLMTASPNGKYIALGSWNSLGHNKICVLRFCNETGAADTLAVINERFGTVGLSFTADSRFLYWSTNGDYDNPYNAHHNVRRTAICEKTVMTPEPIIDSCELLITFFQLGLDGKIYYVTSKGNKDVPNMYVYINHIGTIEHSSDPNEMPIFSHKIYDCNHIPVPSQLWNNAWHTLNNPVQSFFDPFFQATLGRDTVVCAEQPVKLRYYPGASVLWSTGDTTEVLVVTNPGTYSVIASHPDNPGWIRYDTIQVAHKPCTGGCNEVVVSPNPNTGQFTVEVEVPVAGKLELYTRSGQLVASEVLPADHPNPYPIQTSLSQGTYLLRYSNETCSETIRVVVVK